MSGEKGLKPSKMRCCELYKPPTSEDLLQLNETGMLVNSNIIQLQIAESLKELSLDDQRLNKLNEFLKDVYEEITSLPEESYAHWCGKGVVNPLKSHQHGEPVNMPFLPPVKVNVVGSYQLGMALKQELNIDLQVVLPKKCLHEKDYLNQRYLKKRSLYLSYIAYHLKMSKLACVLQYSYFLDDPQKPVLIITPEGHEGMLSIRIHIAIPNVTEKCSKSLFNQNRFQPSQSNIRLRWFYHDFDPDGEDISATPHYNSSVMIDFVMEHHLNYLHQISKDFPEFKDAVKLLKIWLKERHFDKGYGCFNGFIMSMFAAYLVNMKKIHRSMTSHQIIRNVFHNLASSQWHIHGISFKDRDLEVFHKYYKVVFVGPSGVNLCANMPVVLYHEVQHEAQLSLHVVDTQLDGFPIAFMQSVPFPLKFDAILNFNSLEDLEKTCRKHKLFVEVMDRGGNCIGPALSQITATISRGLGRRLSLLGVQLPSYQKWDLGECPPSWYDIETSLSLGLLLDPQYSSEILDIGPTADEPQAVEFRCFWGELSALRHFKDGTIREAVLWDDVSKREVHTKICKYLLQRHCDISSSATACVTNFLDEVLCNNTQSDHPHKDDKVFDDAMNAFNELCQQLYKLNSLPLSVSNVQGVSAILRHSQVFVKPLLTSSIHPVVSYAKIYIQIPVPSVTCPPSNNIIEVVCHLERSRKWPKDVQAMRRLKAAFNVAICNELSSLGFLCLPTPESFHVVKSGFMFHVKIAHHQEVALLQTHKTMDGMIKIRSTPESLSLEKQTVHMPYVASRLKGLQQTHPNLGNTCRLAKRWLAAQMLSDHLCDEATDLLCAYLFLQPAPFTAPSSSQVGFLRFLKFLSSFDFWASPVILNFNDELSDDVKKSMTAHFMEHRNVLPYICIMTCKDQRRSVWTENMPDTVVGCRIKDLARLCLDKILHDIMMGCAVAKVIFTPSLSVYDVIINLNAQRFIPSRQSCQKYSEDGVRTLPVISFEPIQFYLQQLKEAFNDFCIFFHDRYAPTVIAVLWRPAAFQASSFKVESLSCRNAEMNVNISAIIDDFKIMGLGIVESIELQTNRWSP